MTMDSWMADGYIEYPGRNEPPTPCESTHRVSIPGVRLPVVFVCDLPRGHGGQCRGAAPRHQETREWSKDPEPAALRATCNNVNRDLGASCSRGRGHDGQHSGRRRGRGGLVAWGQ